MFQKAIIVKLDGRLGVKGRWGGHWTNRWIGNCQLRTCSILLELSGEDFMDSKMTKGINNNNNFLVLPLPRVLPSR